MIPQEALFLRHSRHLWCRYRPLLCFALGEEKKKNFVEFLWISSPPPSFRFSRGHMMQDAVWRGDAKKVVELMRQDPTFKVNMDQDGYWRPCCSTPVGKAVDPP